ncbi:MAG: thioredoxin domain-containing protein [Planctomycetaceae bacterium]
MMAPIPPTYAVEVYDTPGSVDVSGLSTAAAGNSEEPQDDVFAPPGGLFEPPAVNFEPPVIPADAQTKLTPRRFLSSSRAKRWKSAELAIPQLAKKRIRSHANLRRRWRQLCCYWCRQPSRAVAVAVSGTGFCRKGFSRRRTENSGAAAPNERIVSVAGNQIRLNSRHWPLLGKSDAKYIFVEMFDYTCPHCRNTHVAVQGAFERYGDDLAVIALPVPLNRACNSAASGGSEHASACELAKLAVAVWRTNPGKYREFHDWLFQSTANTQPATARRHAEELVGADALKEELSKPYADQYIAKHVELYRRVGAGVIPKLMFPGETVTGEMNSTSDLCRRIESQLVQR